MRGQTGGTETETGREGDTGLEKDQEEGTGSGTDRGEDMLRVGVREDN